MVRNIQTLTVNHSFTYDLSVPYFSVFGMKADFYGALPFILRIFLISDNGKLHSKIFFTQCTQKVFEAFRTKVIIFT